MSLAWGSLLVASLPTLSAAGLALLSAAAAIAELSRRQSRHPIQRSLLTVVIVADAAVIAIVLLTG